MVQTHTIILWCKSSGNDFKTNLKKVNNFLLELKKFGSEISPNYIRSYDKKKNNEFDWNIKTLESLLKEGVNKENGNYFSELGSSIGFFSSKKTDDSAGISICIGNKSPIFYDTYIINLPVNLSVYDFEVSRKLIITFKECVKIVNPFWGCICNNVNMESFDGYENKKLPTTIHWVNYFGYEISKVLKKKVISETICSKEKFNSGYFIQLKDSPIDVYNESDIKLQKSVNDYLGL